MLKSLFIRNFVLIDSLDIKFDKGFSVITGETVQESLLYWGPYPWSWDSVRMERVLRTVLKSV